MNRHSIKQQTFLIALIPAVVMAVLLSGYFVYTRFTFLDQSLLERAQLVARQLSLSSEYAVFSGNLPLLKQDVEAALTQPDVEKIVVLDTRSRHLVEAAKRSDDGRDWLGLINPDIRLYQDDNLLLLYQSIEPSEVKLNDWDFEAMASTSGSKSLGAVLIKFSKNELNHEKSQLLLLSFAVTLFALMLSLVVAYRISKRITTPILNMEQDIQMLGAGHLNTRTLQETGIEELNELATGINDMARQLQEERNLLENRVLARTAELEAANQKLAALSIQDGLTGLSNRRHLDQVLATEWRRCARQEQTLSMILIDVDHFKNFNDLYGHPLGDACLCRVAALLASHTQRSGEIAARYGGEEFAMVMPGIRPEEAAEIAEKTRQAVAALAIPHENTECGYVTISLGVATLVPDEAHEFSRLVSLADTALYQAKKAGRNRVVAAA
jgi:diguanylate cyclase (GGDEF)-like protein